MIIHRPSGIGGEVTLAPLVRLISSGRPVHTTQHAMLSDLAFALRSLRKSPAYTGVVVLTLALGIGAATAVFGLVDAVLLRPLAYPDGERLTLLFSSDSSGTGEYPPSYLDFADWRAESDAFSGMAFARGVGTLLRGAEGAERLTMAAVSEDFFPVMGVRPLLGRTFLPEEQREGGARVMVLPHRVWTARFGANPAIVGRTLAIDDGAVTVVGVMPPGFDWPDWADAYVPIAALGTRARSALARREFRVDNRVVARLAPGATPAAARVELEGIARRLAAAHPATNAGWTVNPVPLREAVVGEVRTPLLILLGAVAVLLLTGCADVAGLSLVRATARSHEIAVRAALGASRSRIVRQLLVESALLALAGGAAGVLLARWGARLLAAAAPAGTPRLDAVGIDGRALGVSLLLALGSVALFGLAPALGAGRVRAASALRESARGGGGAGRRLRSGFVVAQVALAILLVVGAALLVGSYARLRRVDPGFAPAHLLVARLGPRGDRYDTPEKLLALYGRIAGDIARLPGVRAAAFVNHFPMTGSGVVTPLGMPDRAADPGRDVALFRTADSAYFATAGIRIVRGRGFTGADMSPSSEALVVNAALAERYWPGADPIGRALVVRKQVVGRPDFDEAIRGTIVGVVGNTRVGSLAAPPEPEVFVPMPVNPWPGGYLVVRTRGEPAALAAAVRRAVQSIDADLGATRIEPATTLLAGSLERERVDSLLLSAFAAAALLLASLGIYGVIAFAVAQRTREIGVRAALGARPADVARLFLADGARLALAGIALGIVLALGATRALASMVYGVSVTDPATFVGVAAALLVVALLASWLPARRAARVDPVVALRGE